MTTEVKVTACTRHEVRVTRICVASGDQVMTVVPPGATEHFYAHDGQSIRVDEGDPVVAPAAD